MTFYVGRCTFYVDALSQKQGCHPEPVEGRAKPLHRLNFMLNVSIGPLNCRGVALFFVLTQRTKSQVIWNASLRSWHNPANQLKPGQGPVAANCRTRPALQATFPTALRPHWAPIVLPAFARSRPADRPPLVFNYSTLLKPLSNPLSAAGEERVDERSDVGVSPPGAHSALGIAADTPKESFGPAPCLRPAGV